MNKLIWSIGITSGICLISRIPCLMLKQRVIGLPTNQKHDTALLSTDKKSRRFKQPPGMIKAEGG